VGNETFSGAMQPTSKAACSKLILCVGITWAVINSTSRTERLYEAQLDADTNATQVLSFNANNASTASFAGLEFVIAEGAVKWSVNFSSATNASATRGITLRYRLSDIGPGSPPPLSRRTRGSQLTVIERAEKTPRANMTSYYLAVPTTDGTTAPAKVVVMVVEVFDVALVDEAAFVPIAHAVDVAPDSEGDHYELVLAFPAFNRSLFYDPSIGLGVLLGSSGGRKGDGTTGGDDVGLIVGVVVAIGVAAVVVVAVVVAGVALGLWRKRRHPHPGVVNFDNQADQSGL
jgi:hypothetical protein